MDDNGFTGLRRLLNTTVVRDHVPESVIESMLGTELQKAGLFTVEDALFPVLVKVAYGAATDIVEQALVRMRQEQVARDAHLLALTVQLKSFLEATELQAGETIVSIAIRQADGEIRVVSV